MSKSKQDTMPHYELLYLVSNQFSEDELTPIKARIEKLITDNGGTITRQESFGKKRLAYKIKTFRHGYYELVEFDVPALSLGEINKQLRLASDILRHQIVKYEPKTPEQLEKEARIMKELASAAKENETPEVKTHETKTKISEPIIKEASKTEAKPKEIKVAAESAPKKEDDKDKVELSDLDDQLNEILNTDNLL